MAQSLKKTLDAELEPLGWEPEKRPFAPHLTLGRVKDERGRVSLPWGETIKGDAFPVNAIHLIESQLQPGGPIYTVRHALPFLIQTYRRDTGEIVHDISAPIMVRGRQWGGCRIGYAT